MRRDLGEVMDKVRLLMIDRGIDLHRWDKIREKVFYTPPEHMRDVWAMAMFWMEENLTNPHDGAPEWVKEIRRIWCDEKGK